MRFIICFLFCPLFFLAQDVDVQPGVESKVIDSLYREDQFYAGFQFCFLNKRPTGVSNENISLGFNFGFLRDFPINKKRTLAIAPGIGYAFKNYNTTIVTIIDNNNVINYSFSTDSDKNYLRLQYVDFPLELRWRNSTPETHKFARLYSGIKLSYLFHDRSHYSDTSITYELKYNRDFRRLNYSVYTTVGWNTWNLYFSYNLSSMYTTEQQALDKMNAIEFGLLFYIL